MKWLVRQYLLAKYDPVCLPKPPIGWLPWVTPSFAARAAYAVRHGIWLLDCRLTNYVGGTISEFWLDERRDLETQIGF